MYDRLNGEWELVNFVSSLLLSFHVKLLLLLSPFYHDPCTSTRNSVADSCVQVHVQALHHPRKPRPRSLA